MIIGENAKKFVIGAGERKRESAGEAAQRLLKEYFNSEESVLQVNDYLGRLNAFTKTLGTAYDGLKNSYADKVTLDAFDYSELDWLKNNSGVIANYAKYAELPELATRVSEQIDVLDGAANLMKGRQENLSKYKDEAEYNRVQDVLATTVAEYDEQIATLRSEGFYNREYMAELENRREERLKYDAAKYFEQVESDVYGDNKSEIALLSAQYKEPDWAKEEKIPDGMNAYELGYVYLNIHNKVAIAKAKRRSERSEEEKHLIRLYDKIVKEKLDFSAFDKMDEEQKRAFNSIYTERGIDSAMEYASYKGKDVEWNNSFKWKLYDAGSAVGAGLQELFTGLTGTLAAAEDVVQYIPELMVQKEQRSTEGGIFESLYETNKNSRDWYAEELAKASVKYEDGFYKDYVLNGILPALPSMTFFMYTSLLSPVGGSGALSSVDDVANIATNSAVVRTAANALTRFYKDPSAWASIAMSFGSSYEKAIENGATLDNAFATATLDSLMQSWVEVSGGVQKYFKNGGMPTSWGAFLDWAKSAVEEGNEEVVQDVISSLVEKLATNKDLPIYDENGEAVINPKNLLKSFVVGSTLSGTLGVGKLLGDIQYAKVESGTAKASQKNFQQAQMETPAVSTDGKIHYKGEVVDITGVKKVNGSSDVTFELSNGKTAKASNLSWQNKGMAELATWLPNFGKNQIMEIMHQFEQTPDADPRRFAMAWSIAQELGKNGSEISEGVKQTLNLPEEALIMATGQGQTVANAERRAKDDLSAASTTVTYRTGKKSVTSAIDSLSVEKGKVFFTTENGDKISADSINSSSEASATLLNNAQQIALTSGSHVANVYLTSFPSEGSVTMYTRAFSAISSGAKLGYDLDDIQAENLFVFSSMPEETQRKVYDAFRKKAKNYQKGKVTVEAQNLNSTQQKEVEVLERLAKKRNMTIVVVDTLGKSGLNGAYVQGDNIIYVAADNRQGSLLQVVGHEVVHYIKRWNTNGYKSLAEVTKNALQKEGVDVDVRISEIQKLHKEKLGIELSREDAMEEIVAESFSTVFLQEKAIQTLYETDKGTFRKVIDALKQFIADLKQAIRGNLTAETRAMEKTIQECQSIVDGFLAVLEQTKETVRATGEENDTRFSLSPDPAKDLAKENKKLRDIVSDLQEQFTFTKGKRISNTQIIRIAKTIKKEFQTDVSRAELTDALRALNNYVARAKNIHAADVINEFGKIADEIYNGANITVGEASGTLASDILNAVRRDGNILLTEDQEQEVKNAYGSLKEFRNKMLHYGLSFVRSSGNEGVYLDTIYGELQDALAGYLGTSQETADLSEANMPVSVADALAEVENLNETVNVFDADGIKKEDAVAIITERILEEFLNSPDFPTFADKTKLHKHREAFEKAKLGRQIANAKNRIRTKLTSDRSSLRAKESAVGFLEATEKLLEFGHTAADANRYIKAAYDGAKSALLENGIDPQGAFGIGGVFTGDTVNAIDSLELAKEYLGEIIGGKEKIGDFSVRELRELNDFVSQIEVAARLTTEMFVYGKKMSLQEANKRLTQGVTNAYNKGGKRFTRLTGFLQRISLDPIRIGMTLGDEAADLIQAVYDGEDVYTQFEKEKTDEIKRLIEKYDVADVLGVNFKLGVFEFNKYSEHHKKRMVTLKFKNGTVQMTREEMMSLYAAKKNEMIDGKTKHFTGGGFKLARLTKKRGQRQTVVMDEELDVISNALTDNERNFVNEAVDILSGMADDGNDVSLKINGVKKFGQKYYYPIHVSGTGIAQDVNRVSDDKKVGNLYNSGSTKQRKVGADNSVLISPFLATWADSVRTMGMYVAFGERMSDAVRLWNMGQFKAEIENKYGDRMNKAFANILRDINGSSSVDDVDRFANKALSMFRRNAVSGNASVVVQQPTAVVRAMAEIGAKYFVNTTSINPVVAVRLFNEAKEFIPIFQTKENGSFDVGVSSGFEGRLRGKEEFDLLDADTWSIPAELADKYGWAMIYSAVVKETADKIPNLQEHSQAWKEHVRRRSTEIIRKTQVYDSVLSKSELMRSKNAFARTVTSFMSEPTKQINMLYEGLLKLSRGDKSGLKQIIYVELSTALNVLASSIIYALRNNDEYEKDEAGRLKKKNFTQRYAEEVFSVDTLISLSHVLDIPLANKVDDVFKGFESGDSTFEVFNEVLGGTFDIIEKMIEKETFTPGMLTDTLKVLSSTTGIPFSNVFRDFSAIYREVIGKADKSSKEKAQYTLYNELMTGDYEKMREKIKSEYKGKKDADEYVDDLLVDALKLYDQTTINGAIAYMDGNQDSYETAIADLVEVGVPEYLAIKAIQGAASSYGSSVKKAKDAETRADEANEEKERVSAEEEKASIIERLVALGYDRDRVERAILEAEPGETSTSSTPKRYNSSMMLSALDNSDYDSFNGIRDRLIKEKVAEYTEKDESLSADDATKKAESSLRSSVTRHYKELYINGTDEERAKIRKILAKTGLYPSLNETLKDWEKENK